MNQQWQEDRGIVDGMLIVTVIGWFIVWILWSSHLHQKTLNLEKKEKHITKYKQLIYSYIITKGINTQHCIVKCIIHCVLYRPCKYFGYYLDNEESTVWHKLSAATQPHALTLLSSSRGTVWR